MNRRIISTVLALALVVAVAAPVAANGTTIPQTATVNGALTVTGLPASIDFGNIDPGDGSAANVPVNASITGNTPWVITVTVNAWSNAAVQQGKGPVTGTGDGIVIDAPETWDFVTIGTPAPMAHGPAGAFTVESLWYLAVPADAPAGPITGTMVYTVNAQ